MTERRRANRSHVSYIDKSREYYAAHGYERPYAWATNDDAPFTPLSKPLSESKIGIVTTALLLPDGFVYRVTDDLPRVPAAATKAQVGDLSTRYLSWAKDETNTDDPNSFLPLDQVSELVDRGRIGSLSERFYSLPNQFSQRRTQTNDAPQVLEWMREDAVDVALLVPL